jgi:hypothetical protein
LEVRLDEGVLAFNAQGEGLDEIHNEVFGTRQVARS